MNTREIKIQWNDIEDKVVIKKWTYGERNNIYRVATKGNNPNMPIDPYTLQELTLEKCIVSAPFPLGKDNLFQMDPEVLDSIYEEIVNFNSSSQEKK